MAHAQNVESGLFGTIFAAIGQRKTFGKPGSNGSRAARFHMLGQLMLNRFGPAAQHILQRGFQRAFAFDRLSAANVQNEAQHGQIAAFDLQAPIEQFAIRAALKQVLDLHPHLRRQHIPRQPDKDEQMPRQRRLHHGEARTRPVDQAHHGGCNPFNIALGETDHQVMRQCSQRMNQRLARMAPVVEMEFVDQRGQLIAQARHMAGWCGECGAGPYPGMDRQRSHFTVFDHRDDKQVKRHAAVHLRHQIGLDDEWRGQPLRLCLVSQRHVEPGEGAVIGRIGQDLVRAVAADTKQLGQRTITSPGQVPQLSQHSAIEPAQQFGPFARAAIGPDHIGVGAHRVA